MRDRFSKHDQIGEVRIPLNTIDLAQTIEEWRNLTKVETDGGQVSKTTYSNAAFKHANHHSQAKKNRSKPRSSSGQSYIRILRDDFS